MANHTFFGVASKMVKTQGFQLNITERLDQRFGVLSHCRNGRRIAEPRSHSSPASIPRDVVTPKSLGESSMFWKWSSAHLMLMFLHSRKPTSRYEAFIIGATPSHHPLKEMEFSLTKTNQLLGYLLLWEPSGKSTMKADHFQSPRNLRSRRAPINLWGLGNLSRNATGIPKVSHRLVKLPPSLMS